jgi:hypothetical protein
VTPAVFAFIAEVAGWGSGFIYLSMCALMVAVGVGVLLGDTLARHDAAEAAEKAKETVDPEAAR